MATYDHPTVLVATADTSVVERLRTLLTDSSIVLETAVTGEECGDKCRQRTPAIVMVDMSMPDLEALAAVRCLRTRVASGDVPILLMAVASQRESAVAMCASDPGPVDIVAWPPQDDAALCRQLRFLTTGRNSVNTTDVASSQGLENNTELEALSVAIEAVDVGLVIADADGVIRHANSAFSAPHDIDETLVGMQLATACKQLSDPLLIAMQRLFSSGNVSIIRTPPAEPQGCPVTVIPLRGTNKSAQGYVGIRHGAVSGNVVAPVDQRAQKMEALGRLAGGVAHDFNNLLSVIMGYSQLVMLTDNLSEKSKEKIDQIYRAGERASALTRQLLTFSRREDDIPVVLDFNAVLQGMMEMVERLIGDDIIIKYTYEPDLFPIKGNTSQLEQVVMNLAVNARDAMEHGGIVNVRTRNHQVVGTQSLHGHPILPGEYVVLEFSDTGCGMDTAVLEHIFEPFFSTKGSSGTGLGLATLYGIVTKAGGIIDVESKLGAGTTFRLFFPRCQDDEASVLATETQTGIPAGMETLLVVDDQKELRKLLKDFLSVRGYTILTAEDGVDALSVVEQHRDQIDLVITDVKMPNLSGQELIAQLREKQPGLRALFMSGYARHSLESEEILQHNSAFVQKPFSPMTIARAIRDTLDAPEIDQERA